MVPAIGADNITAMVNQAAMMGGCDCVLLAPDFLRDRSADGVVAKLRMMGQRVCAFGWMPSGPMRELIETAGLDGWVEGPGFGVGVNTQQLAGVLAAMQNKKRQMGFGGGAPHSCARSCSAYAPRPSAGAQLTRPRTPALILRCLRLF